jgi:hypothetical protein
MRIPLTRLTEQRSSKGTRYLAGHIGDDLRLVVVERDAGWVAYLAGESESAGAPKPAKRRAPKAARRATAKQRRGTLTADSNLPVPTGRGFELNDSLDGIGS